MQVTSCPLARLAPPLAGWWHGWGGPVRTRAQRLRQHPSVLLVGRSIAHRPGMPLLARPGRLAGAGAGARPGVLTPLLSPPRAQAALQVPCSRLASAGYPYGLTGRSPSVTVTCWL